MMANKFTTMWFTADAATPPIRPNGCNRVSLVVAVVAVLALAGQDASAQSSFASPEAGVDTFVAALRLGNTRSLRALLGPQGAQLLNSGDPAQDAANHQKFIDSYDVAHTIVKEAQTRAVLETGADHWPLPIAMVQGPNGKWHFDTRAAVVEILARRVGRNELAAIQVCLAIVDAQREFSRRDPDGDGIHEYAAKFASTPGQHDGLYWPTGPDEPTSPLGPLLVAAAHDGTSASASQPARLAPYHGYQYKFLDQQGHAAAGGAYGYTINSQHLGGFAVMAYPARYGNSGVKTFMVNQDGVVYEKDMGASTELLAQHWTTFNPDSGWSRTP